MIEEYFLPLAIEYKMRYNDFWDLSIHEIKIFINANINKENENFKNECFLAYRNADLIGISVSRLFSNKAKYPDINKVFPGMFKKEINPIQEKINGFLNYVNARNTAIERKQERDNYIKELISKGVIDESTVLPNDLISKVEIDNYISFLNQLKKINNRNNG